MRMCITRGKVLHKRERLCPITALPSGSCPFPWCYLLGSGKPSCDWSRCAGVQAEQEEKLRIVQFYNDRLTERERRRDFLRARDLLNMKRMQASPASRRPPSDRSPQDSRVTWHKLQGESRSIVVH